MSSHLLIDLETFSSVDLPKSGVYKYVESPDFEVLLLAYAWDDGPVRVIDLMDPSPEDSLAYLEVLNGIRNRYVVKVAHNCAFERACLQKHMRWYSPPEEWEDTMVLAAYNGLPMSLDAVGEALDLKEKKIKEGVSLINYFSKPCKPTVANGGRTRNLPEHSPDKWERFKEYCRRDVEVEQALFFRLHKYPVTIFERKVFALDARINERGVLIDEDLTRAAIETDAAFREKSEEELRKLTGIDNPNSVTQLKEWLAAAGLESADLGKQTVEDLMHETGDARIRRVLQLRQQLGKTSTSKYEAMLRAECEDGRIRGITQYYGAGRTGRWAGRMVQLQNLPQNHLEDIGEIREILRGRDLSVMEMLFSSVPDTLSQLIRTALIAKPGYTFHVADFSAIEARVIAYLAGEKWRMKVFADGGDIYCASASRMFHVPVEKHGVNGHLRQKGKIAELGLGYGGAVGALKAFGADRLGLTEEEMQSIVRQWRAASPTIPRFWRDAENAARKALEAPGRRFTLACGVSYRKDHDALRCTLPSGRTLSYWCAELRDGRIVFRAQNQTTRRWEMAETWGGKLVENIVQAYARDCLAVAMLRLEEAGFAICFHVHDEVIVEAPDGTDWKSVAEIMGKPIDWAPGLLLRADGYSTKFYMKD